ncbi:MAG: hypothetical protein IJ654_10025 [Bacteroidales bacterium]|nr:hypothetical protein [Bacteroidales bacterium]
MVEGFPGQCGVIYQGINDALGCLAKGVCLYRGTFLHRQDAIHTTKKHWIEEVPDPEHEGETIPTKEITYIDIIQKKTGATLMYLAGIDKYDYFD